MQEKTQKAVNVLENAVDVLMSGLDAEHPAVRYTALSLYNTAQTARATDDLFSHEYYKDELETAHVILEQAHRSEDNVLPDGWDKK